MNKKLLLMAGVLSIIGSTTMAANENTVIENKPNGDVVYRAEHVLDPGRNIYDKTTINHSGIVINRNNDVNNIYIGFNNPHLAENDGIGYVVLVTVLFIMLPMALSEMMLSLYSN